MLCCDLTVTLIVMINVLVLNHTSRVEGMVQRHSYPLQANLTHPFELKERKNNFLSGRHKKTRRFKNGSRKQWSLDPILIKLENVIDKYELRKGELEELYSGVVPCGLSRCEKFRGLIPENQNLRCLGKSKKVGKTIRNLLFYVHKGVQRIEKSFQVLIEYEKWPHLGNGSRKRLLEELKTEIKALNLEIEFLMANKRLNFSRKPERISSSLFLRPKYQTHLMIYEWRIIRDSKRFLRNCHRNLRKMSKCWKKRKREKQRNLMNLMRFENDLEKLRQTSYKQEEKHSNY